MALGSLPLLSVCSCFLEAFQDFYWRGRTALCLFAAVRCEVERSAVGRIQSSRLLFLTASPFSAPFSVLLLIVTRQTWHVKSSTMASSAGEKNSEDIMMRVVSG
jgi:hypothetical protein